MVGWVELLIQGVKGSLEFLFDLGQVLFGQLHLTVNVDWLTNGHLAALALEEVLEKERPLI